MARETHYKKTWIVIDFKEMKKDVQRLALEKDISTNELTRRAVRDYMKKEARRVRGRERRKAEKTGATG